MSATDTKETDAGIGGWRPMFAEGNAATFKRIDKELMIDIKELKAALCEFDSYRKAWAEIIGNDVPPGRNSEYRQRLEDLQGGALDSLDAAAWRLRLRIRGEPEYLTAVTTQRDRALGLLERAINLIAHAPVCLADHGSPCECDHNKLLAEYEALRKGSR